MLRLMRWQTIWLISPFFAWFMMTYKGCMISIVVITIAAITGVIVLTAPITIIAALLHSMIGIIITWGFHVAVLRWRFTQRRGKMPWDSKLVVLAFGALFFLRQRDLRRLPENFLLVWFELWPQGDQWTPHSELFTMVLAVPIGTYTYGKLGSHM